MIGSDLGLLVIEGNSKPQNQYGFSSETLARDRDNDRFSTLRKESLVSEANYSAEYCPSKP